MSYPLKLVQQMLMVLPLALLTVATHAQDQKQNENESQWNSNWGSGKNLYESVCRHCHDPAVGVGTIIQGRNLAPAYIQFIVRNGFNAMPSFPASYIDDESIAQVAEYLASLPAVEEQSDTQP